MVVGWDRLPIADPVACKTMVNSLLEDDSFFSQTMDQGEGSQDSWFPVEEIVKLVHVYFFTNECSLGYKLYMQNHFYPLR